MNTEFNWWLLIVGVVVGAGLVWLVLADVRRREDEVGKAERGFEATWIAETMRSSGMRMEPEIAERVLELHQLYLSSLPPDEAPTEGPDEAAVDSLESEGPPSRQETHAATARTIDTY